MDSGYLPYLATELAARGTACVRFTCRTLHLPSRAAAFQVCRLGRLSRVLSIPTPSRYQGLCAPRCSIPNPHPPDSARVPLRALLARTKPRSAMQQEDCVCFCA